MNNLTWSLISGYSVYLPASIALIRYKKIYRSFKPFVIILLVTAIQETISPIIILSGHSNAINTNIYTVTEALLWLWQFKRWGDFQRQKWLYPALMVATVSIAIVETIINSSSILFNEMHTVFHSFCVVFLSINQVNTLIIEEKKNLLRNSKFLICSGLILFYTYLIMTGSLYIFRIKQSIEFWQNIHDIILYTNIFLNLIFALATLWIPTRRRFLIPS